MKLIVLCMLLYTPALWPQVGSGNARTTGSCSPAVSGNNNTFTITCEGIPKEKAQELTQLMNKILQQQLDPKKVYSELDRINAGINDLGVNLNPLENAPPAETAFLKKSGDMVTACTDFLHGWSNAAMEKQKEYNEKRRQAIMAHQRPGPGKTAEIVEAVDQEQVLKYGKILAPQLADWRSQLVLQVPGGSSVQDYTAVKTSRELSAICLDLSKLTHAYQMKIVEEVRASHHQ